MVFLRKLYQIYRLNLADAFNYRTEGFIYFLSDLIQPLLMMVVWQTVYLSQSNVEGFSRVQMLWYYLAIFLARTILSVYPNDFSRDIKSGDFGGKYLARPVPLITNYFCAELAWKIIRLIFLSVSALGLYFIFLSPAPLPVSWLNFPWIILVWGLAFILNLLIKLFLGAFAFWTQETEGLHQAYYALEGLLSGSLIPLSFLPPVWENIARFLPFGLYYALPARLLTQSVTISWLLPQIILLIFWLLIFHFLTSRLIRRGLRAYAPVGN